MTSVEHALVAPPRFRGQWITPDGDEFEELRWLQNRRIDRKPAVIARPVGVVDVQESVLLAQQHGLELAVRSGGHGFSGNAAIECGIQIDLRLMNDVYVDPGRRIARVRPGALTGDVVRETIPFGLVPVTGMSSEIGYGGITLFGGIGYRAPRYGKTCDNILSLDVVLADGSLVTASPTSHPDLFWAIRGAGDNFGVVTSFEVPLYPAPEEARICTPLFSLDDGGAVLQKLWQLDESLSEDLWWSGDVMVQPDGSALFGLPLFHLGPKDVAEREIAKIAALAPPARDFEIRTIPYRELFDLRLHNLDWRTSSRVYFSGVHLNALDAATTDIIVDEARKLNDDQQTPLDAKERRIVSIYPFTKGLARQAVPPSAASMSGGLVLFAASWYVDPDQDQGHEQWSDSIAHRLADAGVTRTGYNAAMHHTVSKVDHDTVRRAFGDKYERLAAIKKRYDPDNVFRSSANIVPA